MSSFVVVNFNVLDEESLKTYSASAAPTVVKYDGEFIAKGSPNLLNGSDKYERMALIKFPDSDAAQNWYDSSDYQQLIPIRDQAMESVFQLV